VKKELLMKKNVFSAVVLFLSVVFLTACPPDDKPPQVISASPQQIVAAKKAVSGTLKNKGALKFAIGGQSGSGSNNKASFKAKAMFKHDTTLHLTCDDNGDGTFTAEMENADGSGSFTIYTGDFSEDTNGICTVGNTATNVGSGTWTAPGATDPSLNAVASARTCLDNTQLTGAEYGSYNGTGPGYLFDSVYLSNDKGTADIIDDYEADWGYYDYTFNDGAGTTTSREVYCESFSLTATGGTGKYTGKDFSDQGVTLLATYDFTFTASTDNFSAGGTITYAADNSVETWSIADAASGVALTITYASDGSKLSATFNSETGIGTGTYSEASGTKIADVTITPNIDGTSTWRLSYTDGSSETFIG
jgi:hypothetical protein